MRTERDRAVPPGAAVFCVSDQRVSARRELYADLMRAPGAEPHGQQGTAFRLLQHAVVEHGLLDPGALSCDHIALVPRAVMKQQVAQLRLRLLISP